MSPVRKANNIIFDVCDKESRQPSTNSVIFPIIHVKSSQIGVFGSKCTKPILPKCKVELPTNIDTGNKDCSE